MLSVILGHIISHPEIISFIRSFSQRLCSVTVSLLLSFLFEDILFSVMSIAH